MIVQYPHKRKGEKGLNVRARVDVAALVDKSEMTDGQLRALQILVNGNREERRGQSRLRYTKAAKPRTSANGRRRARAAKNARQQRAARAEHVRLFGEADEERLAA